MKKSYEPGTVFLCKVLKVSKHYFTVRTSSQERGVVYIKDISDYFVKDISEHVKIGDILYLTLKEIKNGDLLIFSFKENRSMFLRTPYEFELNKPSNKDEFKNLFDFTNKEVKKWKK